VGYTNLYVRLGIHINACKYDSRPDPLVNKVFFWISSILKEGYTGKLA
jgi:hypothetical protein